MRLFYFRIRVWPFQRTSKIIDIYIMKSIYSQDQFAAFQVLNRISLTKLRISNLRLRKELQYRPLATPPTETRKTAR